MTKVYEFFGGRKFFFVALVFVAACALFFLDKLSEDSWVYLSVFSISVYTGGNVLDAIAKVFEKKHANK